MKQISASGSLIKIKLFEKIIKGSNQLNVPLLNRLIISCKPSILYFGKFSFTGKYVIK
jgi:hypothetical protein